MRRIRVTSASAVTSLNTIKVLISRFGARGAQALVLLFLAYALTPEQLGVYGVLTSTIYLAGQLGHLGLRQSAARYIGKNDAPIGQIVGVLSFGWIPLSALTVFGVLLASRSSLQGLTGTAIVALIVASVSLVMLSLLQGVFLGRREMGLFGLSDGAPAFVLLASVAVATFFGNVQTELVLALFGLSFLVVAAGLSYPALRGIKFEAPTLELSGRMLKDGLPFALSMFVIFLNGRILLLFLGSFASKADVGNFFVAQRLSEVVLEIATAAGLALFANSIQASDPAAALRESAKSVSMLFWLFLALSVGVFFAAPVAVGLLLGAKYDSAIPLVRIFALAIPFSAMVKLLNGIMSGSGAPWLAGLVAAVGCALSVLFSMTLGVRWGAQGVALSFVSSQAISLILYFVIFRSRYKISPLRILFHWLFKP